MGYIKLRSGGTVVGRFCDVCGKEYVNVIVNPYDKMQDICADCFNKFYNGNKQTNNVEIKVVEDDEK